MKLDITWGELTKACKGKLSGPAETRLDVISSDTRALQPGQAFWALKGASFDAHDFLEKADTASGWIVQKGKPLPAKRPEHIVEVADTLKALHALATWHRLRFDIPITAVVGSNGKTTTKQMLRAICETHGPCCATEGNLNNQFGLPFSLLELGPQHHFGVFELGESHPGDIDELAHILQPNAGILTNVGPAHLEWLGDLKGVLRCLSELVDAAPDAEIAINLDDPYLARLQSKLADRAITYGSTDSADVRWRNDPSGTVLLTLDQGDVAIRLTLPVAGKIQAMNAAAAAAGAIAMGLDHHAIRIGLGRFKPAPMRFEMKKHASGATFIVDAYNANPGSMRAGIESFCERFTAEKRILVLGDMKELGKASPKYHRELVEWTAGLPVAAIFVAGPEMTEAAHALNGAKTKAPLVSGDKPEVWIKDLRSKLGPGVAVYLKASRAMQFERIIEAL